MMNEETESDPLELLRSRDKWDTAFEAEISVPMFMQRLERFAKNRARRYGVVHVLVDDLRAADLVQRVLVETLHRRSWKPEHLSLRCYLMNRIEWRLLNATRRRSSRMSHWIEERSIDVESALASSRLNLSATPEIAVWATRALEEVQARAAADPDVLLVLEAYVTDETKCVEVRALTGLSRKRYDAALKRLKRIIDDLPAGLKPDWM